MRDLASGPGHCKRAGAGVSKNIENIEVRSLARPDEFLDPDPVESLFGKYPDMAKPRWFDIKGQVAKSQRPAVLRKFVEKFPFASRFFPLEIFIFPFCLPPLGIRKGLWPNRLRSGADEMMRSKSFQLLKPAGVQ